MPLYYFLCSGSHPSLSMGELDALLEIYSVKPSIECRMTQVKIINAMPSLDAIIKRIVERSGSIKESGEVLWFGENPHEIDHVINIVRDHIDGDSGLWIRIHDIKGVSGINLNELFNRLRSLFRFNRFSTNIYSIIFTDNLLIIGRVIATLNTRDFHRRRPSTRPFFRSVALPIQLSRILINLSRVRDGGILLDPFCGTGSILIEAYYMGLKALGVDIDWDMARGSRMNLRHYAITKADAILSDATVFKAYNVDGIATDPPYGRAASTHGEEVKNLYRRFIENSASILGRGKHIVFMAPVWMRNYIKPLMLEAGFIIKEKYYMFVHSGLTRIIIVGVRI